MKIRLNGVWRELNGAAHAEPTVASVLDQLGYGHSLVATALNGEFVPARARGGVSVRDGDRLEVLAPMQGG